MSCYSSLVADETKETFPTLYFSRYIWDGLLVGACHISVLEYMPETHLREKSLPKDMRVDGR